MPEKAEKTEKKPLAPGYVRVEVLRNHDWFYGILRKGEIVDLPLKYVETQMTMQTVDGHPVKVTPEVFKILQE